MADRDFLAELIQQHAEQNWWMPGLFKEHVKHLLPDSMEVLQDPPEEKDNYNCFMYALGLHTDAHIRSEAKGFIYDTFFAKLLESNELKITEDPEDGDYVVYVNANEPDVLQHVGVLSDDKVISKWSWGPLLKHDVWDVPAFYGDDVFYVESISPCRAKELYEKYERHNDLPR